MSIVSFISEKSESALELSSGITLEFMDLLHMESEAASESEAVSDLEETSETLKSESSDEVSILSSTEDVSLPTHLCF